MKKYVIFTDLDQTLLDHRTYSFEAAKPALELIKRQNIPLVFCSSKTRAEMEVWRRKMDNIHPFIVENGGAVFIPKGYFADADGEWKTTPGKEYNAIVLGTPYSKLREGVVALRQKGFSVRGFGDMTPDEIASASGLPPDQAALAAQRGFDEPFIYEGTELRVLEEEIERLGLFFTAGRFFHLLGPSDKGKAVRILIELYRRGASNLCTVAFGDSLNDKPMLESVDLPFLVRKPDGTHQTGIDHSRLVLLSAPGPLAWNDAVLSLLLSFG